jgi:hypothetical protein
VILVIKKFRLKDGADEAAFLEADERLQREFTSKQPGLLECTTAKATTGDWLVVHVWSSNEAADGPRGRGGEEGSATRAVIEAWTELIDESTACMTRFERID